MSWDCEIYNNIVENNVMGGIWVAGGDDRVSGRNKIYDNIVNNPMYYVPLGDVFGIRVSSEPTFPCRDNEIFLNGVTDNNYGIVVRDSDSTEIHNNLLNHNYGAIEITSEDYSDSINNEVHNNIIEFNELGVGILKSSNNQVFNNLISENTFGVLFDHSKLNTIEFNDIYSSIQYGIWLSNSDNNKIRYNNIKSNKEIGIYLNECDKNNIHENNVIESNTGIGLLESNDNTITENIVLDNYFGISLGLTLLPYCNLNKIRCNTIQLNAYGIYCNGAYENTFSKNDISYNDYCGIHLSNCWENIVYKNDIIKNRNGVIICCSSWENKLYHNNFIDNIINQASDSSAVTYWDNGYSTIFDPTTEGGNYWSDHPTPIDKWNGPGQMVLGPDGIIDSDPGLSPYLIMLSLEDRYPWIKPFDISCKKSSILVDGTLSWTNVKPGSTVNGGFTFENICDPSSYLDWEIESFPEWGHWTFTPASGDDLKPEDGAVTIQVSIVAPAQEEQEFTGEIKIVNKDNTSNYGIIQISLATPKNRAINTISLFQRFLENHPNMFPILRQLLNL